MGRKKRENDKKKQRGGWTGKRSPGRGSLVLSPGQACKLIDVSERSMYRMLQDSEIAAERVGRQWMILKKPFYDRFGWPDFETDPRSS